MRLIAYLMLTVCVAAGALSAATAYPAPLSPDDRAPAGRTPAQNAATGADRTAPAAERRPLTCIGVAARAGGKLAVHMTLRCRVRFSG